jgi:hypothetical protein
MMIHFRQVRAVALAFLSVVSASAATITPETMQRWDQYVAFAKILLANQTTHPDTLLEVECRPHDIEKLKAGNILAVRAENGGMVPVPHGLIHHWIGTVFIPNTDAQSVLNVLQDYDSYSQTYAPAVASSKLLTRKQDDFTYEMRLVEKGFGIKTALIGRFHSHYAQVDDVSGFSATDTEDLAEIDSPGTPAEHRMTTAEAHGFVENVFTVVRYRQRDGGVYLEVETMTLSREIPASVRWFVGPIVQNFSRDVMTDTLTRLRKRVQETSAQDTAERK